MLFRSESYVSADSWWLYGKDVEVAPKDKTAVGFLARKIEGVDMWQLSWSEMRDRSADDIPVAIRSIGPASNTDNDSGV